MNKVVCNVREKTSGWGVLWEMQTLDLLLSQALLAAVNL